MYDLHLHSNFSINSRVTMEEMALAAIDKNLKTICFADRIDLDYTIHKINLSFRTEDYFRNINKVKYTFLKDIEVLAGLEIGMQPHLGSSYDSIISSQPFDYIVMSPQSINGQDILADNFLDSISPKQALDSYYKNIYECVNIYDNFDVLGLFDYVDRYLDDMLASPNYDDLLPLITDILSALIDKGKGIEINSSGYMFGLNHFHPKLSVLKLYRDLGGEVVTFGSSASTPHHIASNYKLMERTLKDLGFRYFYIFRNRKRVPINIG